MKKKIFMLLFVACLTICLTACDKKNTDGVKFKEEYESMNGEVNAKGMEHRSVSIPSDNPMKEVSGSDIVSMIENKETFYVYFGSKLCPWCRSVIETAIKTANDDAVKTIYYVDIWDDDGNEILRDKYGLTDDGKVEVISEGTKEYKKLLKYFDELLEEYNLTNDNGDKIPVNEKRIYAPNFVYIENGKAVKLVEGTSSKQKDSREELTKEILEDEEEIFDSFFSLGNSCKSDKC